MTEQKKLAEAGARKAYFNRYIKAGIHTVEGYQSAPDEDKPQVILGWELAEDLTDEDTPRPMWKKIFGNVTLQNGEKQFNTGCMNDFKGEKSKQTKWFTNMFLDYEQGGNPEDYLGHACRVIIKHKEGSGKFAGNFYDNLVDVRDYDGELPPISQPPVFFDFYNPDQESLDKLFPWEVEFLQEAIDYPGSMLETLINGVEVAGATKDDQPDF